ncbi:hypothetical protein V5799_028718 [Amblyomma americanum]|uniref:Hexosyltransferase n=1 Tax=Amblyomma americanum TaxID=6943 RepID=A0AAQ4DC26_AMBAM
MVACVHCASTQPSPWLVVRDPPAEGASVDMRNYEDVLWDYNELLLSAQALRECPKPRLVAVVRSEAERREQRNVIRRTWGHPGNYANCSFRVVFLMGAVLNKKVVKTMKAEFNLHKDIVVELKRQKQLKTCTLILAAEWVPSYALDTPLALVLRDDTYVDVKAVMSALDRFSLSTGDLFGRVTLAADSKPQLEGCALFAKPRALVRLQPAFADEPLSCDAEESLVTGRLARKAQLSMVHVSNMESCDPGAHEKDLSFEATAMSGRVFTRTRVSIADMKKLYLQDLQFYHNFTARFE